MSVEEIANTKVMQLPDRTTGSVMDVNDIIAKAFGSYNEGGANMNFVTKEEFGQYEKRVDQRFDTVERDIEKMPSLIKKDTEILLNNYDEKRRKGNWAMIGLTITGVSIVVTLISIFLPMLPFLN